MNKNLLIVLFFLASISLVFTDGCLDKSVGDGNHNKTELIFQKSSVKFAVEIADDELERQKGLMFVKKLEDNSGMLFVYQDDRIRSFWMKDTLIPLDMIFIDQNFSVVDINENAQPCADNKNCQTYASKKPSRYVLEINGGLSEKLNLSVGDKIVISSNR